MPRILTILFCVTFLAPRLYAQPEMVPTYSLSRQFVVYGPTGSPASSSNKRLLALDPKVLTVSCERIKQAVLAALNGRERLQAASSNSGEGKIHVVLHQGTAQAPLITPIQAGTFNYRLDLPNRIAGTRLIDAVTEVVLLEMVNRSSSGNFTQLPRWFSTGIAQMVKSDLPETLLLQANLPISRSRVQDDPIVRIRKNLETYAPLTFDELSWPATLSPERTRHYDECAHLFTHELLRLKNGEKCAQQFLNGLSERLNWQVAFLESFRPHFKQLVDVEKWWNLRVVGLSGRDASQLWSQDRSMDGIDDALRIPVQHFSAEASPTRGHVTLQEIVSNWDPAEQKLTLPRVSNQLRGLRMRVHPEFVLLIDEYCAALDYYLQREKKGTIKRLLSLEYGSDLRRSTSERLDALDRRRTELRNRPKPSTREQAILSALEASTNPGKKP